MAEDYQNSALIMDRGLPLGNSLDNQGRRALHAKITNNLSEPIYVVGLDPSVANTRQAVMLANDLVRSYTWADFGTNKERVTRIDYTSVTVAPTQTVRQTFTYTLVSGKYRLDSEVWTVI